MAKGDDFAASDHGDGHSNIIFCDGTGELFISPVPYLTVHEVIAENRDALVKLVEDDVVKNGFGFTYGNKSVAGVTDK